MRECQTLDKFLKRTPQPARSDQLLAAEQQCTIDLNCGPLGDLYQHVDPAKARDAYERNCQLTDFFDAPGVVCESAWRAYTDPKSGITEPVPGRAQQLHDWACEQYKTCWKP